MIKIVGDTHTHTIACDHAFSTLADNAAQAKRLGLRFLCVTEHAPALPGCASDVYFATLPSNLPAQLDGVELIKGAELNILDYNGTVDLPAKIISSIEWVIASYHPPCIEQASVAEHTRGWLKIADNPNIRVIGHCGREGYEFELDTVLRAFKDTGKVVEINSYSLHRGHSGENCREIAVRCAELGIPIVVSSDAHICLKVGYVEPALAMLEEIGFPQELVLNADYDRFMRAVGRIK